MDLDGGRANGTARNCSMAASFNQFVRARPHAPAPQPSVAC